MSTPQKARKPQRLNKWPDAMAHTALLSDTWRSGVDDQNKEKEKKKKKMGISGSGSHAAV